MSTYVCLSVCLSDRQDISGTTRAIFVNFLLCMLCCPWPWLGPPPAGWRNPKGKGQFWGFSSPVTMHCNAFPAKEIGREWVMGVRRLDYKLNDKLTLQTAKPKNRPGWITGNPYTANQLIQFRLCICYWFYLYSHNAKGTYVYYLFNLLDFIFWYYLSNLLKSSLMTSSS